MPGDSAGLFGDDPGLDAEEQSLRAQYERTGVTLDALPYTEAFAGLCERLERGGDERAVLSKLQNMRKARKLPTMPRAATPRVRLDAEQEAELATLVEAHAGSLGRRDGLPYTPAFDALLTAFNTRFGLALSHHDLWRLIAKVAK
jgi:hypothetical protein